MKRANVQGATQPLPSTGQPGVPQRGRLAWQGFGLAVGALLGVLLAPGWGWIARQQMALSLSPGYAAHYAGQGNANDGPLPSPPQPVQADHDRSDKIGMLVAWVLKDRGFPPAMTATSGSGGERPIGYDYRQAIAAQAGVQAAQSRPAPLMAQLERSIAPPPGAKVLPERYILPAHAPGGRPNASYNHHEHDVNLVGLLDLMQRYPDSGLPCAAFLRLAFRDLLRLDRSVSPGKYFYNISDPFQNEAGSTVQDRCVNGPTIIADALHAAQQGERADPANAFFPMMQAVIHLIAKQDVAAYADLDRASGKARWDDYTTALTHGLWSYNSVAYAAQDSQSRYLALVEEPRLPTTALLRAAQLVTWQAVRENRAGHVEAEIALRARLARVGVLWRDQATPAVGPLMGSLCVEIALWTPENGHAMDQRGAATAERDHAYLRYLREHGADREAAWLERALTGQRYYHSQADIGILYGIESLARPASSLTLHWMGGMLLLLECAAFGLIGGFTGLRYYRSRFGIGVPRPLSGSVAGGSALGFLMALGVLLFCAFQIREGEAGFPYDFLLVGLILPMLGVGLLVPLLGVLRVARPWVKAYVLALGCLLGLIGLLMRQAYGFVALGVIANESAHVAMNQSGDITLWLAGWTVLIALALPALLGLLCALISMVRRVPVVAGVGRGFRALTLPILTLLLLGYVATLFSTARLELDTRDHLERCVTNPGANRK